MKTIKFVEDGECKDCIFYNNAPPVESCPCVSECYVIKWQYEEYTDV